MSDELEFIETLLAIAEAGEMGVVEYDCSDCGEPGRALVDPDAIVLMCGCVDDEGDYDDDEIGVDEIDTGGNADGRYN